MRIAITGGSGSLGRALVTRLIADGADRIVTFSRDEAKRAALHRDFGAHPGFRACAGDVRDRDRLVSLFRGCDVVLHGAARKVVTAHPDEPEELLKTNVLGTVNVIEAAAQAGVGRVLIVSSDKAVEAINCYGVSKAMAEHLAVASNVRLFPRGTRVAVVRYGNVLASSGSVVQLWRDQLARGERLQVSDDRMTRFWLSLPQAAGFVLEAIARLRGGEIFVPHLPAAPLLTLAQALAGDFPDGDGPLGIGIGIRPGGEKLHESLLSESEIRRARQASAFYVVAPYQHDEMWDSRPWTGELVDPALRYRSDVWPWQLSVAEMRALLEEA